MPQINQLPLVSQVSSGDQLPVYTPQNGDARRMPISALLNYFEQQFASPTLVTNFYTPSTGFSIGVPTPTSSQWMLLQPASTLAAGTITLPLNTTTPDGTEVLITSTQTITSLAVGLNGAAQVYGIVNPGALNAQDYFRLRYVAATNSWYRIG